ncbi:MAG: recombinase zinc beta ribbon domain-containing protein [Proteobacteria bacterium]|nr:recombinase zinc beta ribbon domain-containing protein [Pseudomonadota bacterium]
MVCDSCGAAMIIESRGRYACSSRANGGSSLCNNHLRVDHEVAETALLSGVQRELLSDDMIAYMQRRVRERIRDMRKLATSGTATVKRLQSELAEIDGKLERIADAIEQRGYSETLETRLTRLEQQKSAAVKQLDAARSEDTPLAKLPDIIPGLVERYRDMVGQIAQLGRNRHVKAEDVDKARQALSALLGPIRVEPRGEVLVAKVTATGARLVDSSPASINRSFVVAGAGFEPATFGL